MTLPDKAIEAGDEAKEKFLRFRPDSVSDRTMTGDVIQAAINALWTDFDAADPDTWPKSEFKNRILPNKKQVPWWIILHGEGEISTIRFDAEVWKRWGVTRYCRPAHITPAETDK